ncbi:hypothetical protein O3M35_005258 [Rhynocoris fuscipes]|uniref:28S ribosomal protein S22, mitochondrial n=1 Tax=Rhynocoris fuscipes TaxID=488301 RepID=A0AAW1DI26_9HEMI
MRFLISKRNHFSSVILLKSFRSSGTRCYCNESVKDEPKASLFFQERVQELLNQLTGRDLEKIYHKRRYGKKPQVPEYRFMSSEELNEAIENAKIRAEIKLQMPPVIPARKEIDHVLATDDKLKGYTESKFVFTDTTYGKNDRNRVIVVREPDGTLRKANWEERNRMNEIFFPVPGRKLTVPKMFNPEFLKDLLARKEYIFILDRACLQFEPDDPEYIRVTKTVYSHINEESDFNILRSTRHFGPLVFYLALNRNIDNLLLENLETDRLVDAVWAIELFNIINPDMKCSSIYEKGKELDFIKVFIDQNAINKGKLELVYNKCKDMLKSNKVEAVN